MKDYRSRLKRLMGACEARAEPVRVIVYKDGKKERTTAHKAIVAAIRGGVVIDHVETVSGERVGGLVNALLENT